MQFLKRTQEQLSHAIRGHAQAAVQARQIYRRLAALLPTRLKAVREQLQQHQSADSLSKALKNRTLIRAIASDDYVYYIDELVAVAANAHEERVQYETNMMLFEARRTIQGVTTRRGSRGNYR